MEPDRAGAPTVTSFELPDGMSWEILMEAVKLIDAWFWKDEVDPDTTTLAIDLYRLYRNGHDHR